MLATALSQLRYVTAIVRNGRISVSALHRLIADTVRTRAEFGAIGDEQRELMTAAPLDSDVRALVDSKRLRKTALAASTTPYYRELFSYCGLDPNGFTTAQLAALPVTPRKALRTLPDAFLRTESRPVLQARTTGTTGTPASIWLSEYERELISALSALGLLYTYDFDDSDVLHLAICSRASIAVFAMVDACRLIGSGVTVGGLVDPAETLARLAQPVRLPGKRSKPSVLDTYPSYLAALLQTAQDLGYSHADFGLRTILCGGEVLSDALRERAETFFGTPVADLYSMTETVPVAATTCEERHLHWSPEQVFVELLDPETLTPAEPGALATLVVTPFTPYRETTLVWRLETGDLVRRLPEPPVQCSLARLPATSRLLGKRQLGTGPAGTMVTTRDVLDVLEAEPGLRLPVRYQLAAVSGGVDLHVLALHDGRRLRGRLEDRIAGAGIAIDRLILHQDTHDMPAPVPVRADLTERSFASTSIGQPAQLVLDRIEARSREQGVVRVVAP